MPFATRSKKSRQKVKYLENKKSFWSEIKSIFCHFKGLSVPKNCLRPESAPLSLLILSLYLLGVWYFFRIFWWRDQWMWLVSCRRNGMLVQVPAPDPKCKLYISSFLPLPHSSGSLIWAKEIMIIVLFLQMMGGWEGLVVVYPC